MSPMSPRLLRPRSGGGATDAEARAYIQAVQTADGQPLEPAIVKAIDDFVIGCKADGSWDKINFACVLMGARTLAGALTPLKGAAPTNVNNNFVTSDYARSGTTPGLLGNGTTKSLNSSRANNAAGDGRNDCHAYAHVSVAPTTNNSAIFGAAWFAGNDRYLVWTVQSPNTIYVSANNATISRNNVTRSVGGWGVARNGSASWQYRAGNAAISSTESSVTPASGNVHFFSAGTSVFGSPRLSFISLGAHLSLDTMNTRVAALQAAISAAIP